jgi:DNA modification methylase
MKNRFNNLTSKEWLPFQKSWFRFDSDVQLYRENIRFFARSEDSDSVVLYDGPEPGIINDICIQNNFIAVDYENAKKQPVQFAMIDLRNRITPQTSQKVYEEVRKNTIEMVGSLSHILEHRKFLVVFARNVQIENTFYPYAWDLAKHISTILSIKDEKIACLPIREDSGDERFYAPDGEVFYCLYFRKDEISGGKYHEPSINLFQNNIQQKTGLSFKEDIPSWFILKPQPRKKDEILHPAKYPEDLVEMFIKIFSREKDNIFDPMSGTGSTQLGAIKLNRNGYGTELSEFFADIAGNRCKRFIADRESSLFDKHSDTTFSILQKDARLIGPDDFPPMDYVITSPPYWDMLNMKGAENQAKRIEKGLQTNYSNNREDLGNINDYQEFVDELKMIYFNIVELMNPGACMTIVVKNIKKKGRNYPFAWDLAHALQEKLILLPETFWCQDDIRIAPYGYGNTWVSNTFHQYCLSFQKPVF